MKEEGSGKIDKEAVSDRITSGLRDPVMEHVTIPLSREGTSELLFDWDLKTGEFGENEELVDNREVDNDKGTSEVAFYNKDILLEARVNALELKYTEEVELDLKSLVEENSNENCKVGEGVEEVPEDIGKSNLVRNTCTRHMLAPRSMNLNYKKL